MSKNKEVRVNKALSDCQIFLITMRSSKNYVHSLCPALVYVHSFYVHSLCPYYTNPLYNSDISGKNIEILRLWTYIHTYIHNIYLSIYLSLKSKQGLGLFYVHSLCPYRGLI